MLVPKRFGKKRLHNINLKKMKIIGQIQRNETVNDVVLENVQEYSVSYLGKNQR